MPLPWMIVIAWFILSVPVALLLGVVLADRSRERPTAHGSASVRGATAMPSRAHVDRRASRRAASRSA